MRPLVRAVRVHGQTVDLGCAKVRLLEFRDASPELSDDLRGMAGPKRGFGSIPVEVTIDGSIWRTSVFPDKDSGCFVLPVKAAVRRAEAISAGDTTEIDLKVVDERLDETFAALANSTRRAILGRLVLGPANVNELAEPFVLTLSRDLQAHQGAGASRPRRERDVTNAAFAQIRALAESSSMR